MSDETENTQPAEAQGDIGEENVHKTPPKRLRVERYEGITHVTFPHTQVDGYAVRELYEIAMQLMEERDLKMLVDLTGIPFASSGTMGMLVNIRKKFLSTGGQLHVAIPDEKVLQQFHVINLHILLQLFPSVDDARSKFKG